MSHSTMQSYLKPIITQCHTTETTLCSVIQNQVELIFHTTQTSYLTVIRTQNQISPSITLHKTLYCTVPYTDKTQYHRSITLHNHSHKCQNLESHSVTLLSHYTNKVVCNHECAKPNVQNLGSPSVTLLSHYTNIVVYNHECAKPSITLVSHYRNNVVQCLVYAKLRTDI